MQTLARNLFDFDAPISESQRWYVRLVEVFVVFYSVWFVWVWAAYIPEISSFVLPLGVAEHVDMSFMFRPGMASINAGLITVLGVMGFARVWRGSYMAALLLFHIQYVSRYSLGEISHGSNFIGMSLLAFALAAIFFSDRDHYNRFAMGAIFFFFGLGYTSAAVCKLVGTGLDWSQGEHLLLWIGERQVDTISRLGIFEPNIVQDLIFADARWGTLVLTFGLVTEAFGWLLWFKKTRYFVLWAIIGLHFGIALSMNIFFETYTYQLLLLSLPGLAALYSRFSKRPDQLAVEPTG